MDITNVVNVAHDPTIWPLHRTLRDDRSLMGGSMKLEAGGTAYHPISKELHDARLPLLRHNCCHRYDMADGRKGSAGNDGEYGEQNDMEALYPPVRRYSQKRIHHFSSWEALFGLSLFRPLAQVLDILKYLLARTL